MRSAAAGQGRSQEEPVTPAPWDSSTPGAVPVPALLLPHAVTTEGGCEELVQGTRCGSARGALARQEGGHRGGGNTGPWVGCLEVSVPGWGCHKGGSDGVGAGEKDRTKPFPHHCAVSGPRRAGGSPTPCLHSGTLNRVPRPPQAQKRVQRHPQDHGMMEMGGSHNGAQPQSKSLFQASSAGSCS